MSYYSTDSKEHEENIGLISEEEFADLYSWEEYLEDIGELPSRMELESEWQPAKERRDSLSNYDQDEADQPDFDWRD